MERKGFACSNIALGAGSFSMQCVEEDGELKPFTIDTYSITVKATYCEVNGNPINIFKNPKTDTGRFKNSHKGCCRIFKSGDTLECVDGLTWNMYKKSEFKRERSTIPLYSFEEIEYYNHCG